MTSLNKLYYFQQIARLESISKASEALFVSQSALSKSLHELEEDLGCSLFDRHGKRLRLNEDGMYLLEITDEILNKVNSIKDKMSEHRQSNRYFYVDDLYHDLSDIIYTSMKKLPFSVFLVSQTIPGDSLSKLRLILEHKLDMALLPFMDEAYFRIVSSLRENNIESILIVRDQLYLSAPKKEPYIFMKRCTFEEIEKMPLTKYAQHSYYTDLFERLFAARKRRIKYVNEMGGGAFQSLWPQLDTLFVTTRMNVYHRDYCDGFRERHQILIDEPDTEWGLYLFYRRESTPEMRTFLPDFKDQIYDAMFPSPEEE